MNTSTLNLAEEEEKFQIFLFEMSDRQEAFIGSLSKRYTLDYTLQSLAELERYIRENQIDWNDKSDNAVSQRLDCWTYLGEVMRHNYGGSWHLSWNDENTTNHGQYVIIGHTKVLGIEFTPLRLVKAFIQRGRGGELLRAVQAQINPVQLDLSDLRE
jgi:hypothetical protein